MKYRDSTSIKTTTGSFQILSYSSLIIFIVLSVATQSRYREMDGYTRAVSGQRLGKHVPAATKRNNGGTVGKGVFQRGPCRGVVIRKTIGATKSVPYGSL
jgi:hypothetical protein